MCSADIEDPFCEIDVYQIVDAVQHKKKQFPLTLTENFLLFYREIEGLSYSKTPIAPKE
jgi:hypothetical protein